MVLLAQQSQNVKMLGEISPTEEGWWLVYIDHTDSGRRELLGEYSNLRVACCELVAWVARKQRQGWRVYWED